MYSKIKNKENIKKLAKMDTHFTGQGRDINQLRVINEYIRDSKTIMFVGCSTGEEIIDFQSISNKSNLKYYGIDYDDETIKQAKKKKYFIKPKIFSADILNEDFYDKIKESAKNKSFDVVICRNLLIYYNDTLLKKIIEKLSEITKRLLVIGISDPADIIVKDEIARIGKYDFKIIDFDNRIFEKIH